MSCGQNFQTFSGNRSNPLILVLLGIMKRHASH